MSGDAGRPTEPPPLDSDLSAFFTLSTGRWVRGLETLGFARDRRLRTGRTALASIVVTYVPLLALSAGSGLAWGDRVEIPLLRDFLPYGRFLLGVPFLILAEPLVAIRLARVSAELRQSNLLAPAETERLNALLASTLRLWTSGRVTLALLVVSFAMAPIAFEVFGVAGVRADWEELDGRTTLAGLWNHFVSSSVLRFVFLRWLLRLFLWSRVLWRLARLRFRIFTVHPDRAGGLAFLGESQESFALLFGAISIQIACLIADGVAYRGDELMSYQAPIVVYALLSLLVLFAPLAAFAPQLLAAKERALVVLSSIAYRGNDELVERLVRDPGRGWPFELISGMSDFSVLFETARGMRAVPTQMRNVFVILAVTLMPFAPLVFLVFPPSEVFQMLAGLLL